MVDCNFIQVRLYAERIAVATVTDNGASNVTVCIVSHQQ